MAGKLTAIIALLLAIPVIGTAASTLGQEDFPPQVAGDTLGCPDGSSVQSEFRLEGDAFFVTGTLVSLDTTNLSVVIAGPSGDVSAALTVNAEVDAGLQPGMPVHAEGALFDQGTTMVASVVRSACPAGGTPSPSPEGSPAATQTPAPDGPSPTPTATPEPEPREPEARDDQACNRGPGRAGEFHVIIHGNRIDIKRGTVSSAGEGSLMVMTPFGDISVMIDADTRVKGDLSAATEVMVKGTLDDATVDASQVKVLCPHEAHQDKDDGDDDGGGETPSPTPTPTTAPLATPESGGNTTDDDEGETEDDEGRGHDEDDDDGASRDEDEDDDDGDRDDNGNHGRSGNGNRGRGNDDRGRSDRGKDDD